MKELIDKNSLFENLRTFAPEKYDDALINGLIRNEPEHKGSWVKTQADMRSVKDESKVWWRCSCCNNPALMGRLTAYCPNCGARMERS